LDRRLLSELIEKGTASSETRGDWFTQVGKAYLSEVIILLEQAGSVPVWVCPNLSLDRGNPPSRYCLLPFRVVQQHFYQ
jgi:hypothetical protein